MGVRHQKIQPYARSLKGPKVIPGKLRPENYVQRSDNLNGRPKCSPVLLSRDLLDVVEPNLHDPSTKKQTAVLESTAQALKHIENVMRE